MIEVPPLAVRKFRPKDIAQHQAKEGITILITFWMNAWVNKSPLQQYHSSHTTEHYIYKPRWPSTPFKQPQRIFKTENNESVAYKHTRVMVS